MAFPITQAFVHNGDYDETTRSHPAIKWLESYTIAFDAGLQSMAPDIGKWHSPDLVIVKADGSVHNGLEAGWNAVASVYGVLAKWHHQPEFVMCTETEDGWQMLGVAKLFYSLPGEGPSAGATDNHGNKFESSMPGGFRFHFEKSSKASHGGIWLRKSEFLSDSGPIVVQLLQRGVLKPADIGL